MTDITNDSGFMIQIWNDIKNGGSPLVILCFFLVLYFLKPYLHSILSYIGRLIKGKLDSKVKNYKIEDINVILNDFFDSFSRFSFGYSLRCTQVTTFQVPSSLQPPCCRSLRNTAARRLAQNIPRMFCRLSAVAP